MGKALVLATVLVAVAITFWRPLRRVRTALGVSHLVATGHVFLALGFLLGLTFGEREATLTEDISPIVALVAGWVGFATGMRFEWRTLRTVPARAFAVALFPALVAAAVIGGLSGALLYYARVPVVEAVATSIVLAAAAASSGPTLAAMIRTRRPGRSSEARPVLRMIEFSAGVDDLVVVALAMFAFALFRTTGEPVAPGWLIVTALGGGALLGAVTWLFLGGRASEDERLLLSLGMLLFIAGFSGWLRFSPAAIAAVAAAVLVNLPGERMKDLLGMVQRVERPAVVILMVVVGFQVTGRITWLFFPLVLGLTLLRFLCKRWAGVLIARVQVAPGLRMSPHWGDGLTPQGLLGLMVALSFFHVWRDDVTRTVLAAIATASIINEIVAPWLFLSLMKGVTTAPSSSGPSGSGGVGRPSFAPGPSS